jgi:hypothetical protein
MTTPLRLAVPNKGRLLEPTVGLLRDAGLVFDARERSLVSRCENFPLEILFARIYGSPAGRRRRLVWAQGHRGGDGGAPGGARRRGGGTRQRRGCRRERSRTRTALAGEVADLLYHVLVLCAERDLEPSAVLDVLRARRRA